MVWVSVRYCESLGDMSPVGVKVREPAERVTVVDWVEEPRELENDCVAVSDSVEVSRERVFDGVGKGETLGLLELLTLWERETSSLRLPLSESVLDNSSLKELVKECERLISSEREWVLEILELVAEAEYVALTDKVPPDKESVGELDWLIDVEPRVKVPDREIVWETVWVMVSVGTSPLHKQHARRIFVRPSPGSIIVSSSSPPSPNNTIPLMLTKLGSGTPVRVFSGADGDSGNA
jgi:hypothetical protein